MKIELCAFSGYKIYPDHGRTLVKVDGKTYKFLSGRTQKAHDLKKNSRKINWTVLNRRKPKEDVAKKRNRRTQKFQRAVVGASLPEILAKRNQKPEVRKAQREQAIRAAKEQGRPPPSPPLPRRRLPLRTPRPSRLSRRPPRM